MLKVIILKVIMLTVIMLSVVESPGTAETHTNLRIANQGTLTETEGSNTVHLLELTSSEHLIFIENIINLCY